MRAVSWIGLSAIVPVGLWVVWILTRESYESGDAGWVAIAGMAKVQFLFLVLLFLEVGLSRSLAFAVTAGSVDSLFTAVRAHDRRKRGDI